MLTAVIRITSDDVDSVVATIRPESGRDLPRTKTNIRSENGSGIIEIIASDVSAMRAALNSNLECIRITEEIGKITKVRT